MDNIYVLRYGLRQVVNIYEFQFMYHTNNIGRHPISRSDSLEHDESLLVKILTDAVFSQ